MKRAASLTIFVLTLLLIPVVRNQGEQYNMYLPTVAEADQRVFVGDKVALSNPMLDQQAEYVIAYHISDAILTLEEMRYEGTIDFENGELYDQIILALGTHAVQGSDKPYAGHPNLFRQRYARLLNTAMENSVRVIAINIPWLNWTPDNVDRAIKWNGIIAEEAAWRNICVADAWSVMFACGMECIQDDGYHPNEDGYRLIAKEVAKCVDK